MSLSFSIVMPTLNRRDMLLDAIASIRAQSWPDVEIIVVDGGSTDGTLDALAAQRDVRVINGPDRGLYDACNKGISAATGDIIGLLNSDDLYESGTFLCVAQTFATYPYAHAVCGTAFLVEGGRVIATFDDDRDKSIASARTTLIGSCIPNARFFRSAAVQQIGPFSLDYRYVADRDWLTRWYEAGFVTAAIPQRVYRYRQHAGSLTFDASRRHSIAIYCELMKLAWRWQSNAEASLETRRMAALLNGRCIARLVIDALRHGRPIDALELLFIRKGRVSAGPLADVWASAIDKLRERRSPR